MGHELQDSSKIFAIKLIPYNENTKNETYDEVQALESLNHTNICKLVDAISYQDTMVLVMPKYDGDLFDLILSLGGFNQKDIKRIFIQLYHAISYAHSKGWAHRDLKLENIMYATDPEFTIKLADFGFATQSKTSTRYCGTPGYASAECMKNIPYDTRMNDVWGLAVILLRMASRKDLKITDYVNQTPRQLASTYGITQELAEILLMVFVPEHNRITLDEFYNSVIGIDQFSSTLIYSLISIYHYFLEVIS